MALQTQTAHAAAADKSWPKFRYCLNTSTINGGEVPVREQIQVASKAGYDAIELWLRDVTKYVERGGKVEVIRANREVILSASSINTPKLLMLSGIGPAAQLLRHGIDVIHDAPEVGENLADHLDITVMSSTKGRQPIGIAPSFIPRALLAAWKFMTKSTGELVIPPESKGLRK